MPMQNIKALQMCPTPPPERQQSKGFEQRALIAEGEEGWPFPDGLDDTSDWELDIVDPDYRVRATDESKLASPALQALTDLSDVELANEQEQDLNSRLIKDMIRNSPERPSWEHVCAGNAVVKAFWSQHNNLKIWAGTFTEAP